VFDETLLDYQSEKQLAHLVSCAVVGARHAFAAQKHRPHRRVWLVGEIVKNEMRTRCDEGFYWS
jgi:hypothetical protein